MAKVKLKSLMLSIVLTILITSIPAKGLAEDNLDKHIEKVRTLFEIGDDYGDFHKHEYDSYDGKTITSLSWRSDDSSISVNVDEDGEITGYWKDDNHASNNSPVYKFPKISKEEGEKVAREFIEKLYPDILDQLTLRDDNDSLGAYFRDNLRDYGYSFVEKRNDIIFNENTVYISVDTQTGEISNLNISWEKNLEFENTEGVTNSYYKSIKM